MLNTDFKFFQHREVGFGAHFKTVLCLIDYCLDNKIKCHIDIRNTSYSNENENTWEVAFGQPFSEVNPEVVISDQFGQLPSFADNYWNLNYESSDRQKYADHNFVQKYKSFCTQYIKVNDDILEIVNEYTKQFESKKVLGIHKRGREHLTSGHARGQEHLLPITSIFSLIDEVIDDYDYLFLTSDEISTYNKFQSKYQDKLLIYDNKTQYVDSKLDINYLKKSDSEKVESLKNLMIETLILSKCDKMFLMNSNVSHMALFFSDHFDYQFYDSHLIYS